MSIIIHSGKMEKVHQLPFHVTDKTETIVFEKDIIDYICKGDAEVYTRHFLSSPNYFLNETTVEGWKAFPLLAFANECISIFEHQVEAEVEKTREMTESLRFISRRVFPIVSAVAKVGAKVEFGDMAPGETPAMVFERAVRESKE